MELTAFGLTDIGRVRPDNEDAILLEPAMGLFAVADGMGGHKGGEVASQICLDTLKDYLLRAMQGQVPLVGEQDAGCSARANLLASAVRFANRAVFEAAFAQPEWRGMGTTVVAMLQDRGRAVFAHVGDSRAYLLRDGSFRQITRDHSWVEEQVRAGLMSRDEALFAKGRNVLTRAIGQEESVQVDVNEQALQAGDRLLLCSDGLYGMVADAEIAALIGSSQSLEKGCRELMACANSRGGRDNISVILLEAAEEKGLLAGMRRLFTKA